MKLLFILSVYFVDGVLGASSLGSSRLSITILPRAEISFKNGTPTLISNTPEMVIKQIVVNGKKVLIVEPKT